MRVSMATLEDSGNYSVYTTREECDGGMTDCKVGVVTIQVIPYGKHCLYRFTSSHRVVMLQYHKE